MHILDTTDLVAGDVINLGQSPYCDDDDDLELWVVITRVERPEDWHTEKGYFDVKYIPAEVYWDQKGVTKKSLEYCLDDRFFVGQSWVPMGRAANTIGSLRWNKSVKNKSRKDIYDILGDRLSLVLEFANYRYRIRKIWFRKSLDEYESEFFGVPYFGDLKAVTKKVDDDHVSVFFEDRHGHRVASCVEKSSDGWQKWKMVSDGSIHLTLVEQNVRDIFNVMRSSDIRVFGDERFRLMFEDGSLSFPHHLVGE